MNRGVQVVISEDLIELIAKEIHRLYIKNAIQLGTNISDIDLGWEQLPETLKKSNVRQAKSIIEKLDKIDMFVLEGENHPEYEKITLFSDTQIELLAEYEHNLWVSDRLSDGWTYGLVKDVTHKISPYLVPYDQLDDDVKALDRNTIVNILPLLQQVGLYIYRQK